jgi:hypothetical protein
MTNEQLINQLLNGYHLSDNELIELKDLVSIINNLLNQRIKEVK